MRSAPWTAALAILALGAGAALLGPGRMRRQGPADPSGRAGGGPPGETRDDGVRVARAAEYVVEPASPIVGPDGTLAEALGIETAGGRFMPVLPRGATVPATRMLTFGTASEDQTDIRLHLLRGVAESVDGNHSLGWFRVVDLLADPSASSRVAVFFRVTDDGITLAAVDPAHSRSLPIEASAPPGIP